MQRMKKLLRIFPSPLKFTHHIPKSIVPPVRLFHADKIKFNEKGALISELNQIIETIERNSIELASDIHKIPDQRLTDEKFIQKVLLIKPDEKTENRELHIAARFLLECVDYSNFPKEKKILLLNKALQLIYSIKNPSIEDVAVGLRITNSMKNGKFIAAYFTKFMKLFVSKSSHEIPTYALIPAFMSAPHLGQWREMVLIGEELLNRDSSIMEYFHNLSYSGENMDIFDYSILYELAKEQTKNTPIIPTYHAFKVKDMQFLFVDVHEEIREEGKDYGGGKMDRALYDEWLETDYELPLMIAWGAAVVWYQINGEIVLSGVTDGDFRKIHLKGRAFAKKTEENVGPTQDVDTMYDTEFVFNTTKRMNGELYFTGTHKRGAIVTEEKTDTKVLTRYIFKTKGYLEPVPIEL